MDLHQKDIDHIQTPKDLANFVRMLLQDYLSNSDQWENPNLASYLEAMAAWIDDSNGYYQNMKLSTPDAKAWQTVAKVLLAATIYE